MWPHANEANMVHVMLQAEDSFISNIAAAALLGFCWFVSVTDLQNQFIGAKTHSYHWYLKKYIKSSFVHLNIYFSYSDQFEDKTTL